MDPLSPGTEAHWVARAKTGDTQAYGQLAQLHQTRIYRFVLKYVRCEADARDLTQEALLQGFRCIGAFQGHSRFSTWLTGIALNLARNHVNRSPAHTFVEYEEDAVQRQASPVDDPVCRLQSKQTLRALSEALATLPAGMRDCLVLVALEELSYEEAAQVLGLPVGSVKSNVSRARQRLRAALSGAGQSAALVG